MSDALVLAHPLDALDRYAARERREKRLEHRRHPQIGDLAISEHERSHALRVGGSEDLAHTGPRRRRRETRGSNQVAAEFDRAPLFTLKYLYVVVPASLRWTTNRP